MTQAAPNAQGTQSAHPAPDIQTGNGQVRPSWFEQGSANTGLAAAADTQSSNQAANPTQATTTPAASASTPVDSALIGRTTAGLAVVILIILVAAWLLKRFGVAGSSRPGLLKVVASRSLGHRERVVVVEIEDEWLVLGVAPGHVNCLHRRPAGEALPDHAAGSTTHGFADRLAARLGGNVQRESSRREP